VEPLGRCRSPIDSGDPRALPGLPLHRTLTAIPHVGPARAAYLLDAPRRDRQAPPHRGPVGPGARRRHP